MNPRDRKRLSLLLLLDGQREHERSNLVASTALIVRARVLCALIVDAGALSTRTLHRIAGETYLEIQAALATLAKHKLADSIIDESRDEVLWYATSAACNGIVRGDLDRAVPRAVDLALGCEERTYSGAPS